MDTFFKPSSSSWGGGGGGARGRSCRFEVESRVFLPRVGAVFLVHTRVGGLDCPEEGRGRGRKRGVGERTRKNAEDPREEESAWEREEETM